MNPFHGNKVLEDLALYAIDWGIFLRHSIDSPLMPFLFVQQGPNRHTRVLVTDGDVMAYAMEILQKEPTPYEAFVIGAEGTLSDENGTKVDAVIVQAFATDHTEGVMLAQGFEPLEKNGTFKKIDRLALLDQPPNPLPLQTNLSDAEAVPSVQAARLSRGEEGEAVMLFAVDTQPSRLMRSAHRYWWHLLQNDQGSLSGHFTLMIQPSDSLFKDFTIFLFQQMVEELQASDPGQEWQKTHRKVLSFNLQVGEEYWVKNFEEVVESPDKPPAHSLSEKQDSLIQNKPWWKFWG